MFAASLCTDICPQREESSSTSHARNPFNLNFFDSAQCLMVRRRRLIGYFPILYNPYNYMPPRWRRRISCVPLPRIMMRCSGDRYVSNCAPAPRRSSQLIGSFKSGAFSTSV
jgi:hypothetical protein